jgi:glycosyltransferase involved in cell wall biosynthesis
MTDAPPFLSIVIPAYNEEKRLPGNLDRVMDYLKAQPYSAEVVVVDDGSADGTVAALRPYAEQFPQLGIIENDHRGKAYAVRTGMLAAQGDYVLFTDADLPTPLSELPKLLDLAKVGHDVVIGSREGLGARRVGEPEYRHLMGRVFNFVVRMIALGHFQDTQCGFKLFTRDAAHDLFRRLRLYGEDAKLAKGGTLTGFDVEVLYLAVKFGYRVADVPVEWHYGESSKVHPIRESIRMFQDVVRVRLNDWRGKYRQPVAAKGKMGGLPPAN